MKWLVLTMSDAAVGSGHPAADSDGSAAGTGGCVYPCDLSDPDGVAWPDIWGHLKPRSASGIRA